MLVIEPTKGRGLTDWSEINWTAVERNVKRVQGRIFRAAKRGEHAKLKNLQKLLARSASAKLLAIRRVTQKNRGKHTPGIDGLVCDTPEARLKLFQQGLSLTDHRPKPVRRVYIPKPRGTGRRPLGIPTIKDRVLQTLVRLALEPEWETRFEANSHGFRPGRCTMDAVCALHAALCHKGSSRWILKADISGCFDHLSHTALLAQLPVFTETIRRWLKAGTVEFGRMKETLAGAPQGSPLSPLLMNVALDGMGRLFGSEAPDGRRVCASARKGLNRGITLVRYADDVVTVAPSKERIEDYLLPKLKQFLSERGLSLSEAKTRIVCVDECFDFLGFTFMRQGGKLLVKPCKQNVLAHLRRVKAYLNAHKQTPAARVIQELNPVLRGWANYQRHSNAKETLNYCDHRVWAMLWRWALRRHPRKSRQWIKDRYFSRYQGRDWTFGEKGAVLFRHGSLPVTRFVKVRGKASPMNPDEATYWEARRRSRHEVITYAWGRRRLLRRQRYRCVMCGLPFEEEESIDNHHVRPRGEGGSDVLENLMLAHRWCHRAHHVRRSRVYRKAARA